MFLSVVLSGCFPGLKNEGAGVVSKPGEFVKGKAVKGFPDLPLYPESKLIETYGDGSSFGASAYTTDEIAKVVTFYETSLVQLKWESSLAQDKFGNYIFTINNDKQKGWVIVNITGDGKTVGVTIAVAER